MIIMCPSGPPSQAPSQPWWQPECRAGPSGALPVSDRRLPVRLAGPGPAGPGWHSLSLGGRTQCGSESVTEIMMIPTRDK